MWARCLETPKVNAALGAREEYAGGAFSGSSSSTTSQDNTSFNLNYLMYFLSLGRILITGSKK